MKILVINCGSSSLKYQLIDSEAEQVLAKGLCERIGIEGSMFTYQKAGCDKVVTQIDQPDHKKSISIVLEALTNKENGVIADFLRSVQSDTDWYTVVRNSQHPH